jgi:CheY-like chemotaxis protein
MATCNYQGRGPTVKSVLVVEDSRFLRLAIERTLVRAGYSVMIASDGEEALRIAYARIPDLILLDMLLPKLGGPDVLHALKKTPLTAQIPVIVLSSLSQKNETKLKKFGATAYFEKSKLELDQHSDSLIQIVNRTLDGLGDDGEVRPPAGSTAESKTSLTSSKTDALI